MTALDIFPDQQPPAGPHQTAILEHAKLISRLMVEFEESARHPRNRIFTKQQIAQTAVNEYAELTRDAINAGRVKMATACITAAAHLIDKFDLKPEPFAFRYVNHITDGDGITRVLSRPVRVF